MKKKNLRSQQWFNNPKDPEMTALYLERYLNYGLTRQELQSGKPIIGIAQSGSDLSPCNRHFLSLSKRIKDGIVKQGGIPMEFPTHPIQETGKRPTAMLDRNLSYLSLVEVLYGYPIDGVILTTGCDKTTPAALMAAATVNIPAIVLSGGPMLDGNYKGKLAGSGTIVWEARKLLAKGEINYEKFMDMVASSAPSIGHCNTMGTASSMNSVAEALGMSLPGCAVIPAPYREREQISYETGKRIVQMVHEDLKPSKIMTKQAFENAVVVASAIGGSSNCTTHLIAIAKHMGIKFDLSNWQKLGHEIPLLVNCQPAGEYLMEKFYRAGGIPAVMKELIKNKKINTKAMTVTGKSVGENLRKNINVDRTVIKTFSEKLADNAGFLVMKGNFFSSAIMKTSVISKEFTKRYLSNPKHPNMFYVKAVVFEGPEDYHKRINNKNLKIDENSILIIRGCGPVGYPGSAEVVNMQPPNNLLKKGINALPTLGDGRQSGTSESPSILHVSPESAIGGDIGIIKTGDKLCIDLNKRRVDLLISKKEFQNRRKKRKIKKLINQTPWQEISRNHVGQLEDGACIQSREIYLDISEKKGIPRNSH
ncbi:MAG: IlvD/Edd family dehydratase [Candidatus Pelagibacter sp.]|jgi:dihydroxy-acid dehydratase|nr:dihydroxy-acid dehydratase [Pseudomonadota bacterium]NCX65028.1 dihydroxy-acid dehydratase [Pseudomonadota bacterium]